MSEIVSGDFLKTIRSPNSSDVKFDAKISRVDRVLSASGQSQVTVLDSVYDRESEAQVIQDGVVDFGENVIIPQNEEIELLSSDELVAEVKEDLKIEAKSEGSAEILFTTKWLTKKVDFPVAISGSTSDTYLNSAPGSLSAESETIVSLMSQGFDIGLFSTYNVGNYVYNANNWAINAGIDLSGVSAAIVRNNSIVSTGPCTLISDDDFLCSTHYKPIVGDRIDWLVGSSVYSSIVSGFTNVTDDISVGHLASSAHASIKRNKLFPADLNTGNYIVDAQPYHFMRTRMQGGPNVQAMHAYFSISRVFHWGKIPSKESFWIGITQGDSGSPSFFKVGSEYILIGHAVGIASIAYHNFLNEISAACISTIQVVDLSAFPTYN